MTENTILTLAAGHTEIEVWTLGARLNAATWDGETDLLNGAFSEEGQLALSCELATALCLGSSGRKRTKSTTIFT